MTQIFHTTAGLRKRRWLHIFHSPFLQAGDLLPGDFVMEVGCGCDRQGPAWMGRWQRCCWWGSGCGQAPAGMMGWSDLGQPKAS